MAVPAASCADALRIALSATGNGGSVIVPAYTCERVLGAIHAAGSLPVLVDVEPSTGAFLANELCAAVHAGGRGVLLTHLFGLAPDLNDVIGLMSDVDGMVIEDRALVLDSRAAEDRPAQGAICIYSFGRGKPLAVGGGGAMLVNDLRLLPAIELALTREPEGSGFDTVRLFAGALRDSRIALSAAFRWARLSRTEPAISAGAPVPDPWISTYRSSGISLQAAAMLRGAVARKWHSSSIAHGSRALAAYRTALTRAGAHVEGYVGSRLPDGVYSPALAMCSPGRDGIIGELARIGVDCPLYWRYSLAARLGFSGFSGASRLAGELFFLPLHQGINDEVAMAVGEILRNYPLMAFN